MNRSEQISATAELLRGASRPLFVWGAGMRPCRDQALALARSLGVPVACTWGAIDLINHDDPLAVGGFGTHGIRSANLTIQNADLIVSIGTRLDTKSTGTTAHFAREAQIVMVDIDHAEISKFEKLGRKIDIGICVDAGNFLDAVTPLCHDRLFIIDRRPWRSRIATWKYQYKPTGPPYDLMRQIAEHTNETDIIVSDTGNTLGWIMQGFPFKGERMVHAWNMTPMGYGLPGAIGASFASDKRVICICGDGGLLMSVNELATARRWNRNIKIILFDNGAHAMCMNSQRQWLGGNYYATSKEGGLGFPNWLELADAFRVDTHQTLDSLFSADDLGFLKFDIDREEALAFQTRYGFPIEDMEPSLPREELAKIMEVGNAVQNR